MFRLSVFKDKLLDLIYPRDCLQCENPVPKASSWYYFCEPCVREISWVSNPICIRCGRPFHGEIEGEKECVQCVELKPFFSQGRTVFRLSGLGREIIHTLKYNNGK